MDIMDDVSDIQFRRKFRGMKVLFIVFAVFMWLLPVMLVFVSAMNMLGYKVHYILLMLVFVLGPVLVGVLLTTPEARRGVLRPPIFGFSAFLLSVMWFCVVFWTRPGLEVSLILFLLAAASSFMIALRIPLPWEKDLPSEKSAIVVSPRRALLFFLVLFSWPILFFAFEWFFELVNLSLLLFFVNSVLKGFFALLFSFVNSLLNDFFDLTPIYYILAIIYYLIDFFFSLASPKALAVFLSGGIVLWFSLKIFPPVKGFFGTRMEQGESKKAVFVLLAVILPLVVVLSLVEDFVARNPSPSGRGVYYLFVFGVFVIYLLLIKALPFMKRSFSRDRPEFLRRR